MSRRRRTLLWAELLVALAGVGLVGVRWLASGPNEPAELQRIQNGMFLAELVLLFGSEPSPTLEINRSFIPRESWTVPGGRIDVHFHSDMTVCAKEFVPTRPEPLFVCLRAWLGL